MDGNSADGLGTIQVQMPLMLFLLLTKTILLQLLFYLWINLSTRPKMEY